MWIKEFICVLLVGLAFAFLVLGIWAFSLMLCSHNQSILSTKSSSIEQMWSTKGSWQWWNSCFLTIFIPVIAILALGGVVLLFCGILIDKNLTLPDFSKMQLVETEEKN